MKERFTVLLKSEHLIPVSHGMSDEEMFKDIISSMISSEKFDLDDINNKNKFFICRKISFDGNHVGYSQEEKRQSTFVYKDHQNRYQSTDFFNVEYKERN